MTILRNWFIHEFAAGHCLEGQVYDHPTRPDGERVTTSPIRGAHGRVVVTSSGSTYTLGEPLADWAKGLAALVEPIDEEEPVKRWLPKAVVAR